MTKNEVIGFASDHAGFEYKEELKKYVENKGFKIVDLGTFSPQNTSYAEFGKKLGAALHDKEIDYGIAVCGTGLGMSYALNRFNKVRAARTATIEDAHLARQHNDANALALGSRTNTLENAKAMVDEFIKTEYEGGRHQSRIDQIERCDKSSKPNCSKGQAENANSACENSKSGCPKEIEKNVNSTCNINKSMCSMEKETDSTCNTAKSRCSKEQLDNTKPCESKK